MLLALKLGCCRWNRRNGWARSRGLVHFYWLYMQWKTEMREIPRAGSRGGNAGSRNCDLGWESPLLKDSFPQSSIKLSPSIHRCGVASHSIFQNIFSRIIASSEDLLISRVIRREKGDFPAVSDHSHWAISLWFSWSRNFLTFGVSKRSFRKPDLKLQLFERNRRLWFNRS